MQKSLKKTNLAQRYNTLNNDSKKILLSKFQQVFKFRTNARFYKLLGKPKLLTALEADFFSQALNCERSEILETVINTEPLCERVIR